MNTIELPITRRTGIVREARQSARLLFAILLLGLANGSVRAQAWEDRYPVGCRFPNPKETQPWTPANPLTSSTSIGTILMERRLNLETQFGFSPPGRDPYELVIGAHWYEGLGPPLEDDIAPTNIDGIGFKWVALSKDGVYRTLRRMRNPVAVDKMDIKVPPGGGLGGGGFPVDYVQQLVLTKDPNALGAGELKVTHIIAPLQVKLYAAALLKSAGVSLGSTFEVPTWGDGCRQSITYESTGIVSIGGGPPPPILNKRDVVANQIIPVDLGHVPLDQFKKLNDTSPPKHFEIALSNCAVNARPTISFRDKATPPNTDKTVLRLSAPGGQKLAKGFGIIMTREDGTRERIAYGDPGVAKKYEMTLDKSSRTAKLPLSAQYIRTGSDAEVDAGYAGGSAEFTFTFP